MYYYFMPDLGPVRRFRAADDSRAIRWASAEWREARNMGANRARLTVFEPVGRLTLTVKEFS